MSAFDDDLAENMKSPEFAYEYGRAERELEIVKLLEGYQGLTGMFALERDDLIALIKGENK